ncbi:MAG TPA: ABC transporter permease [Vicinamibacterales bacterium]|nr:ABC transporter permease [Vicinamibacterales bacterium]
MTVPFELQIALRYLLAKRKQALISLISVISMVGVGVGVMAVIIALAVMTGLQQEVRDRILGATAHVNVYKKSGITDYQSEVVKLRQIPHVLGAAPAIFGQGLITAGGEQKPIVLKGIDPTLEPSVTQLAGSIKDGGMQGLESNAPDAPPGILLGSDLATSLGLLVGDTVSVTTTAGIRSPIGQLPLPRRLRVVGIFTLGFYEIDSTYGMVSLATAKRLLDLEDVELIQLRVDNIYDAPAIAEAIPRELGDDYSAQDWGDMNKSLYSALRLEKIAVSLAIGLIVMVAALNIVATLILLVMEKHRDIAILKTMGTSARSVTTIFVLQGLIIGVVGTTTGAVLAYAACVIFDRYKLIQVPVDVYQISYLPFTVLPGDFALVVGAAILICLVATIYPSRQAARLDPAQALRYE